MQKQYAEDGLVCVSVSVDEVQDQGAAVNFLKKSDATFPNYLLDEPIEVWEKHFGIAGTRSVFVYDRAGKLAGRFTSDSDMQFTHADVEQLVRKLLPVEGR